jgi:type III restriction enzyme
MTVNKPVFNLMATSAHPALPLVKPLAARVAEVCAGIETGAAPILEQVTPTTADLLRWWFQQDCVDARAVNFHDGQRQALLHTIYADEVLGAASLAELYQTLAPEALLGARRLEEVTRGGAHPKYCLKLATGTDKTWVLQALLVWQALNAARAPEDARFTRNFLVVAPGNIVYARLLDSLRGRLREGRRDFATSDLSRHAALFVPEIYREELFRFAQGAVCEREELGRKVTGGGVIAVTNWQRIKEQEDEVFEETDAEADMPISPGFAPDPKRVAEAVLPLAPGVSAGNSLEVLNRRFERGDTLAWLRGLPDLMVFNDEAHHIHEVKSEGEITEVEWQRSLRVIAEPKGRRFAQVDFSATPYNQVGSGKKARPVYFPHIVADFDLKAAMRAGLVKSLVLDKRRELGALADDELQFTADRDEHGNPILAEGQRIMLRAGLAKLRKLERDFASVDPLRHPKMLVVCEDTTVTPRVETFFHGEGLAPDEVLRVDSNKKGDISESDWAALRERLFDMDAHPAPRVVVSVLMLREGFDVNNICVIVPLRSTGAKILLEQTVGRGLRLMWREPEFADLKRENRERIRAGEEPGSLIDVLSIVEHPRFQDFYDELMADGLVGETEDEDDAGGGSAGDLISVGLREGSERYDFAVPFVVREEEEQIVGRELDVSALTPFDGMTLAQLKAAVGKGEVFRSHDVQTGAQFGDYRVDGGIMTATSYNEFISRLVRRVTSAGGGALTNSAQVYANRASHPLLQVNLPQVTGWVDDYVRERLFGPGFEPMADENWRVLRLDPVAEHIVKEFGRRLPELVENEPDGAAEVVHRSLSEIAKLTMREAWSLPVQKCVYERLPFPSRSGGFEKAFIETADADASIEAFCKIHEQRHAFLRLRYVKENGLNGFYSPDFLVRAAGSVWVVETKSQAMLGQADVVRKKRAALAWCERINRLPAEQRGGAEWRYCLLGESLFYGFREKGATLADTLEFSRVRLAAAEAGKLFD